MRTIRRNVVTLSLSMALAVAIAIGGHAHWRASQLDADVQQLRADLSVTWEKTRDAAFLAEGLDKRTALMSENLRWAVEQLQSQAP